MQCHVCMYVYFSEDVGSGQDCFSCLHDRGQETVSLLYVCRDNCTVVAGVCGPQAPFALDWTELEGSCPHLPPPGSCLSEGKWVLFLPETIQRARWEKTKGN